MSLLSTALNLAERGFHVFPLIPNSKKPTREARDFPNKATRDPEKIKAWWLDPVMNVEQPFNIGISTTKYGDNETLVVIDVDNKGVKKGDIELLQLEMQGNELPVTYEQVTPTGGRHLVFRANEAFTQGVKVFGSTGLDIRAKGGYIVAAGSVLDNVPYTFKDNEIAFIPDWLADKLKRAREKAPVALPTVSPVDEVKATGKATAYLLNEAPISIKGEGGDQTAFKVACRVKDLGVSAQVCFELMLDYWNPRSPTQWSPEKLRTKINNAYKYGTDEVGAVAPEKHFEPVPETPAEETEKSYLDAINDEFALIIQEGGHVILRETTDEKGRPKRLFLPEATFKRIYSPFTIQNGKGKPLTFADVWLDWSGRRQYSGLCFAPGRDPGNNYYNLWRGFACDPISEKDATPEQNEGLKMFLDHALQNVCKGDFDLFTWLIGYFAHAIQKPHERPLTTLVFKGMKGTGKNALIERFGKLLGRSHFLVAHDGRYLTSNFNGHMDSCLMLVLDEAFWSGDKNAEGKLKGLTTSPELLIERKGKEPYTVDNLVRLVVIGNEDWLVPATSDERRYAVFQMGEGKMQNRSYFEKMRILLDDKGGCGRLLDFLMKFDLSSVDVNDAPKTEALLEQKMHTADLVEQWWIECLQEGRFIGSDFNDQWVEKLPKEEIRNSFTKYLRKRNISNRAPTAVAFGKKLNKMCPSVDDKNKKHVEGKYHYEYRFPSVGQARKEYENYIGHEVKWNE